MAFPIWLARTVQVPVDKTVRVSPEIEQVDGVKLVNVTAREDEEVAVKAKGAVPKALLDMGSKVMDWDARLKVKVRNEEVADS